MTLDELVKDAVSEFRGWAEQNPDETEPHDTIRELADSAVPIHYADLLKLASDNVFLATNEPELGPAFDGSPTPINIIAANVYEHVESELWDEWREIEEEREEAELEEQEA